MTDYSDLVQRLRLLQEHLQDGDAGESADALEAQAKRIAELEAELKQERERCAKIAENIYYPNEGKMIAAAIREDEPVN
jgi:hypothetical protein